MTTLYEVIKQINPTEIRLTYSSRLLHLIHATWPEEIELVAANYSLRGVKAIIRDKDEQEYVLEIYPK